MHYAKLHAAYIATVGRSKQPTQKFAILCEKVSILTTLVYLVWVRKARCSNAQSNLVIISIPAMIEGT